MREAQRSPLEWYVIEPRCADATEVRYTCHALSVRVIGLNASNNTDSESQVPLQRSYDIVVFGATGFTGSQAARYLASHPERDKFRFAIGGRSEDKLHAVATDMAEDGLSCDGVMVADGRDAAALDRLARKAHVVLSTAGPFAKFGSELVRACVAHGTDYVDITGETPWVRAMIDLHHVRAGNDGTRIIPCCGYDSIPSDLGMLFVADLFAQTTGMACTRVRAFHRGKGGINGGTVASMLNLQRDGGLSQLKDPFLLNPEGTRPASEREHRDPVGPIYSRQANAWVAPFFMGPINTRVVRRSHALLRQLPEGVQPLALDFSYQEYWKAPGVLGLAEAGALSAMQATTSMMGWLPGATKLVERVAVEPGEGPSEAAMDNGNFSCELVAQGETGEGEVGAVQARLWGKGDPGNRITIKCVCESALLIALQPEALPREPHGGVLTPASGLGLALVPRLEAAGIHFEAV